MSTITAEPQISTSELFDTVPGLEDLFRESGPENKAHIIRRLNAETGAHEYLAYAIENGLEVEALCGYRWVPTKAPGDEMEVCATCVERFGQGAR